MANMWPCTMNRTRQIIINATSNTLQYYCGQGSFTIFIWWLLSKAWGTCGTNVTGHDTQAAQKHFVPLLLLISYKMSTVPFCWQPLQLRNQLVSPPFKSWTFNSTQTPRCKVVSLLSSASNIVRGSYSGQWISSRLTSSHWPPDVHGLFWDVGLLRERFCSCAVSSEVFETFVFSSSSFFHPCLVFWGQTGKSIKYIIYFLVTPCERIKIKLFGLVLEYYSILEDYYFRLI